MIPHPARARLLACGGRIRWAVLGHVAIRGCVVRAGWLSSLVTLLTGLAHGPAAAQLPPIDTARVHLSVHPRELAVGEPPTVAGGLQRLESFPAPWVYVPAQCVGPRRCPLVVFEPGEAKAMDDTLLRAQQPFADQYGTIIALARGWGWSLYGNVRDLDTLLLRLLRTYPIDPEKVALVTYRLQDIALVGVCANVGAFSRVVMLSPTINYFRHVCDAGEAPSRATPTTRVYVTGGLSDHSFVATAVLLARRLRSAGYAVDSDLALHGYEPGSNELAHLWQWLSASWAAPAAAGHSSAAPEFLLTASAIDRLTTFWRRFQQAPDSIRVTARLAHQRQITVPVRTERFTLRLMDTPALARRCPSVAADLAAAGLTAEQADAYRMALITTAANMATWWVGDAIAPVEANSPVAKNIAFLEAHKAALKVLGATGMWTTP